MDTFRDTFLSFIVANQRKHYSLISYIRVLLKKIVLAYEK